MTDMDTRLADFQAGILPEQPRGDHPSATTTAATRPPPADLGHSYPSPVHGDPVFAPSTLDPSASLSFSSLNQSPDHHSSSPQPNALSGDATPVDMLAVFSTPPLTTSIPSVQGTVSAAAAAAAIAATGPTAVSPRYLSDFSPQGHPPSSSSSAITPEAAAAAANGPPSASSAFNMNIDADHSSAATLSPSSIIPSPELLQNLSSPSQQSQQHQQQQTPFSASLSPFATGVPHIVGGGPGPATTLSESSSIGVGSSAGGFNFPPTDLPPPTATTVVSTPGSSSDNAEDGHMLVLDNMLDEVISAATAARRACNQGDTTFAFAQSKVHDIARTASLISQLMHTLALESSPSPPASGSSATGGGGGGGGRNRNSTSPPLATAQPPRREMRHRPSLLPLPPFPAAAMPPTVMIDSGLVASTSGGGVLPNGTGSSSSSSSGHSDTMLSSGDHRKRCASIQADDGGRAIKAPKLEDLGNSGVLHGFPDLTSSSSNPGAAVVDPSAMMDIIGIAPPPGPPPSLGGGSGAFDPTNPASGMIGVQSSLMAAPPPQAPDSMSAAAAAIFDTKPPMTSIASMPALPTLHYPHPVSMAAAVASAPLPPSSAPPQPLTSSFEPKLGDVALPAYPAPSSAATLAPRPSWPDAAAFSQQPHGHGHGHGHAHPHAHAHTHSASPLGPTSSPGSSSGGGANKNSAGNGGVGPIPNGMPPFTSAGTFSSPPKFAPAVPPGSAAAAASSSSPSSSAGVAGAPPTSSGAAGVSPPMLPGTHGHHSRSSSFASSGGMGMGGMGVAGLMPYDPSSAAAAVAMARTSAGALPSSIPISVSLTIQPAVQQQQQQQQQQQASSNTDMDMVVDHHVMPNSAPPQLPGTVPVGGGGASGSRVSNNSSPEFSDDEDDDDLDDHSIGGGYGGGGYGGVGMGAYHHGSGGGSGPYSGSGGGHGYREVVDYIDLSASNEDLDKVGPNDIPPEFKEDVDRIFLEYLNRICSNLEATDAAGEKIHQALMAKKMQRLDESPDFRPFKFRIQAFTNGFVEELAAQGYKDDKLPLKKVRNYLWAQPLILRFNGDGKKAKSKGNHIWNIDAKKKSDGTGWIFRPFRRVITGAPQPVAYVGLMWTYTPRIHDPWGSGPTEPIHWLASPLPSWLSWNDGTLSGVPTSDAQNCDIKIEAHFAIDGIEHHLSHSFQLKIAPTSLGKAAISPGSRRPSISNTGDARRVVSDSTIPQLSNIPRPGIPPSAISPPAPVAAATNAKDAQVLQVLTTAAQRVAQEAQSQLAFTPLTEHNPELEALTKAQHALAATAQALDERQHLPSQMMNPQMTNTVLAAAGEEVVLQAARHVAADHSLVAAQKAAVGLTHLHEPAATVTVSEVTTATQNAVAQAVDIIGPLSTDVDVMRTATEILSQPPMGVSGLLGQPSPPAGTPLVGLSNATRPRSTGSFSLTAPGGLPGPSPLAAPPAFPPGSMSAGNPYSIAVQSAYDHS